MSADLSWEHQFCLACDRQTEGATYCSESCRLSDFEKSTSSTSSPAQSPGLSNSTVNWTTSRSHGGLYLSPAYDFTKAQLYGSASVSTPGLEAPSTSTRVLTPSSSHSSLYSLQSTTSSNETTQLSSNAKQQLRDYASSFEHAQIQRRRSY